MITICRCSRLFVYHDRHFAVHGLSYTGEWKIKYIGVAHFVLVLWKHRCRSDKNNRVPLACPAFLNSPAVISVFLGRVCWFSTRGLTREVFLACSGSPLTKKQHFTFDLLCNFNGFPIFHDLKFTCHFHLFFRVFSDITWLYFILSLLRHQQ